MGEDCLEIRKDLDAFVDEELEARQQAAIEEHFKNCRPCLQLYRLIVGVKNRLRGSVKRPQTPAHLRARVLKALDEETAAAQPRWSWSGWLAWRPAQALALGVLVIVAFALLRSPTSQAHNFAEISMAAWQRHANHETHPFMPDTETYRAMYPKTGLPDEPMPSLATLRYKPKGCCFGLTVERPVAHYVYRDEQDKTVSVVKWKRTSPEDTLDGHTRVYENQEYSLYEEEGVRLILWESKDVFWSVFGEQPTDELLKIASVIRS